MANNMDDTQRIVKCGNLSLHTSGGFFKKRWHSKYLVLYDGSKSGVKRLELFESEIKFKKQNPVKIIPLVDCVRIVTCQRHKTTFTFEVRTSDQFYLLASKSFQDMNDWVNCLRLVAFGQQQQSESGQQRTLNQQQIPARDGSAAPKAANKRQPNSSDSNANQVDVLLNRQQATTMNPASNGPNKLVSGAGCVSATSRLVANPMTSAKIAGAKAELRPQILTAGQAAETAASALAKARQRQPSLLGSCKPQPPDDSPFIKQVPVAAGFVDAVVNGTEQMDTLTPTVRGQLIAAATSQSNACKPFLIQPKTRVSPTASPNETGARTKQLQIGPALDEEEENMLYCSIEDNPSEHNYRVKVIETELALRCQLKCYQLTGTSTISQQYEELAQFRLANPTQKITQASNTTTTNNNNNNHASHPAMVVTFYQLIIGPQELTLLNDYATNSAAQARTTPINSKPNQQGLWSWPYQCIRRYGFDKDNCFMFEAGRKCSSGPGQFVVQTPKAYNIYQDVVKFVNELRTISASGQFQKPIAMTQAQTNDSIQLRGERQTLTTKQLTVTQIPVIWTPSGNGASSNTSTNQTNGTQETPSTNEANQMVATRRQFFDGLQRQPDCDHQTTDETEAEPIQGLVKTESCLTGAATASSLGAKSMDHNQPTPESQSTSPRLPQMKLTTRNTTMDAAQEQKLQRRPQLSSMSSCASDETDESGYEQGDDSVDSGGGVNGSQRKLLDQPESLKSVHEGTSRVAAGDGLRTASSNRLHESEHSSSNLSSTASSCSPASSASNSPGQSISRRTADLMANSSRGSNSKGSSICQSSTRPRLPLPNELTRHNTSKMMRETPTTANEPNSMHSLLAASLMERDARTPKSETQAGIRRPTSVIKSLKANQYDDNFETSLIRDVYSEISKLHAKFAVTTTEAEDSLSSGGESAVASSSSLDNNTEVIRVGEEDNQSQVDSDDLLGRGDRAHGSRNDEQEPMYSNLKPVTELNLARRSANERDISDRHHDIPNQMRPANTNRMHFHEPMRPPPLYPSMLNPIPEIAEHHQNPTPPISHEDQSDRSGARDLQANQSVSRCHGQAQRQLVKQADFNAELDRSMDLPRARLALNRETIKKSQQSIGPQQYQQPPRQKSGSPLNGQHMNRPTNHYLINDVQYAKISRNMTSVGRPQYQDNIQRRR